jgi:hypothetical protein
MESGVGKDTWAGSRDRRSKSHIGSSRKESVWSREAIVTAGEIQP